MLFRPTMMIKINSERYCLLFLKKSEKTGMLDSSGIHARLNTTFECKSVLIASEGASLEFLCGFLFVHSCKSGQKNQTFI